MKDYITATIFATILFITGVYNSQLMTSKFMQQDKHILEQFITLQTKNEK